jgi:hypothetical protein
MNKTQQRAFGRKTIDLCKELNLLTMKGRLLYLKTQFVPRSKHFSSQLQKPIIYQFIGENSLFVVR